MENQIETLKLRSQGTEVRPKRVHIESLERQRLAMEKTTVDLELMAIDEEIERLRQSKAAKKKELKAKQKAILVDLRNNFRDIQQLCMKVPDFEDGMMYYYTMDGELFDSRPLMPNERQYSINSRIVGE